MRMLFNAAESEVLPKSNSNNVDERINVFVSLLLSFVDCFGHFIALRSCRRRIRSRALLLQMTNVFVTFCLTIFG